MRDSGLDRLRTTTGNSGIGNSSLTYDGLGNIKTYNSKDRSLVYNYNTTDNRLTSVTGIAGKYSAFAYDDRGNIYGNGGKTFTYNRANQLVSSGTNSYTYDGHNRRVKQTDSKGTSYSLYSQDGTLLYRETPKGGINYIYLGNKLIAKDGVIPENAGKQHFRPYGESIEGEIDDAGYTGHKFDTDLGLSYMQARYYDPIIGRFYSNDPVGYTAKNPVMSFNRYMYVNNNPYKYTDPDGKYGLLGALYGGIAGAVGGAITGYAGGGGWGAVKGGGAGLVAGAVVGFLAPQLSANAGTLAAASVTAAANFTASISGQVAGNVINGNNMTDNVSAISAAGAAVGGVVIAPVTKVIANVLPAVPKTIIGVAVNSTQTANRSLGNTVAAVVEGTAVGVGELAAPTIVETAMDLAQ